jgi:hypothetical protein
MPDVPATVPAWPRSSARDRLLSIAHALDAASTPGCSDVLVSVAADRRDVVLGLLRLDPRRHPCEELRGMVARDEWWAVGIVVAGRARFLDQPDREPEPILTTYLVERGGAEVSLLRRRREVTESRGRVEGRIPDLCRSMLGLL